VLLNAPARSAYSLRVFEHAAVRTGTGAAAIDPLDSSADNLNPLNRSKVSPDAELFLQPVYVKLKPDTDSAAPPNDALRKI
jgi:hypothetical protein